MQPALRDFVRLAALELRLGHEQSFDNTQHIAEVGFVEEFAGGRTQFRFDEDFLEEAVDCFDAAVGHALDLLVELAEVIVKDTFIDASHGVIWRHGNGERREETLHAVRDRTGAHLGVEGGADQEVVELDKLLEVLEVVGVLVVDDLLEQLDGRLSAVVVG